MKFGITCDANAESGVSEVMFGLNDAFEEYFGSRFYDDLGTGIFIVLMCRDPAWNFKQRIRFVKKRNTLYIDILLDLNVMSRADITTRKRIVSEKIMREIPQIIAKYKFNDFDLQRFTRDLRQWFEAHGWIESDFSETLLD